MQNNKLMDKILCTECGEAKANAEFSCDECVADDVEMNQKQSESNGKTVYKSTCDYTMISPKNQTESAENVFDYSGS